MHAVIVIPGIMGTEILLSNGARVETIWPPTPLETQLGYNRIAELASPDAVPGRIIGNVLCFDFYKPLFKQLAALGFKEGDAAKRLVLFPYDWRRDLFTTADRLSAMLGAVRAAGATRISLVAHSMGGLIARLLLEDPRFRAQPWFAAIDQLIAVATPHLGAPLALGRVMGRDSALGISGKDFATLSNNPAYPSAYQLLPAPGEGSCWDQSTAALETLDIYDAAVAATLGLDTGMLARAKALHDVLGAGNVPKGVRYFYFGSTGHRTATRVNIFRDETGKIDFDRTVLTLTDDGGDGTVPLYSALPRLGQRHLAVNEHTTAFTGGPFHKAFVRLLGGNDGDATERPLASALSLSVESPVVETDRTVEVLLYFEAADDGFPGAGRIHGELVLTRTRDGTAVVAQPVRRIAIDYTGPPVAKLRIRLTAVDTPGHYQLTFEGTPGSAAPAAFSACSPLPRKTRIEP